MQLLKNETLDILMRRRSVRAYTKEQIREEELNTILNAGLYAPCGGDQEWHFTAVQSKALLAQIGAAAKEGARHTGIDFLVNLGSAESFDCLHGVPTLIIVSALEQGTSPVEDCSAATENMLIAAESLGLGSCWMFFALLAFSSSQGEGLRMALKIPEGYRPYTSVGLGYSAEETKQAAARKQNLITIIQ